MTICCSCRKEFNQTSKISGNFCPKCNRRIKLKLEWRGCLRRLKINVNLSSKARAKTKQKMVEINTILIEEFGVDMNNDLISCPGKNIKH